MIGNLFIKTRTSDSKGRLTGFPPNATFEVVSGDGEFRCTPAESVGRFVPKPMTDEGLAYLKQFDLNPHMIAKDSADETGYDEFQLDDKGDRVYLFGRAYTIRKPWPEKFDWEHFVQVSLVYKS